MFLDICVKEMEILCHDGDQMFVKQLLKFILFMYPENDIS